MDERKNKRDFGGNDPRKRERRSRSRSRDRSNREYGRYERQESDEKNWRRDRAPSDDQGYYGERGDYRDRSLIDTMPSPTIMIKGLPAHTTEPTLYAVLSAYSPKGIRLIAQRDTGECKGFAFVEFHSTEYSSYFMNAFAGSCGDPNASQLIVDNRAVTIEYARELQNRNRNERDEDFHHSSDKEDRRRLPGNGYGPPPVKCDWICDSCGCQNFARRTECYRCSVPKSDKAILINSADPYADAAVISTTPTATLVVRNLSLYTTEDQILEAFRQFAVVHNVHIIRDRVTGISRGVAFIEFPSSEYAGHALEQATYTSLTIDRSVLKIAFAKDTALAITSTQSVPSALPNSYAAAALQAAQWSANNGYSSTKLTTTSGHPSSVGLPVPPTSLPPTLTAPPRSKPKWPPRFETHGAAYLFQPQTGLFLEPITEFYYCPKSKLYYSAQNGIYYTLLTSASSLALDITDESCFSRFLPPAPTAPSEPTIQKEDSSELLQDNRKPIVLSMSFGSSSTSSSKSKGSAAATSSKSNKKEVIINNNHVAPAVTVTVTPTTIAGGVTAQSAFRKATLSNDLAKWEEIKRKEESAVAVEAKAGPYIVAGQGASSEKTASSDISRAAGLVASVESQAASVTVTPTPPAAGTSSSKAPPSVGAVQFACFLCRRQFPTQEGLQRHEKESKLHAENLLKAESNGAQEDTSPMAADIPATATSTSSTIVYRDRASERRATFGTTGDIPIDSKRSSHHRDRQRPDISHYLTPSTASSSVASAAPVIETIPQAVSDDVTNPGNQLLRRFGWQEGQGLGKDGLGTKDPVALKNVQNDKDKIGVGMQKGVNIPPVEYGEGRVYKDSLLRAARARYEQVEQTDPSSWAKKE